MHTRSTTLNYVSNEIHDARNRRQMYESSKGKYDEVWRKLTQQYKKSLFQYRIAVCGGNNIVGFAIRRIIFICASNITNPIFWSLRLVVFSLLFFSLSSLFNTSHRLSLHDEAMSLKRLIMLSWRQVIMKERPGGKSLSLRHVLHPPPINGTKNSSWIIISFLFSTETIMDWQNHQELRNPLSKRKSV